MQKWEYRYLWLEKIDWPSGVLLAKHSVNGDIRFTLTTKLPSVLAELGQEGWELVASPDKLVMIFKRPIEPTRGNL